MRGTLTRVSLQEYRRRFNLDPLVKQVSKEEEVLQQQGRTRATVRPYLVLVGALLKAPSCQAPSCFFYYGGESRGVEIAPGEKEPLGHRRFAPL